MFAIVSISGKQFKVTEGQELYVNRIDAGVGEEVTFDQVHLTADGENVQIGAPVLNLGVKATVVEHLRDDKVIVFKKKRSLKPFSG